MTNSDKIINDVKIYNDIIKQYQNEQASYLLELEIVVKKIRSIFDNPKSGINGDRVDVIFGNIGDILTIESSIKESLEEAVCIAQQDTLVPVGTVFHHIAKLELLDLYVYYANNYSWSLIEVQRLRANKDILKYTFADCVKLGCTADTVLHLLDVLLFKPIHYITTVFHLIRELAACLRVSTETVHQAALEISYLDKALYKLQDSEIAVQDVLDRYYNEYRYYPLYLVPRPPLFNNLNQPLLLFSGYIFHILDKTTVMKAVEITEETITLNTLNEKGKEVSTVTGVTYPVSTVTAVKDYNNHLNQFSITLQDQVLQFLSNSPDSKNDIVNILTVLLCRRIFIDSSSTQHPLKKPSFQMCKEHTVNTDNTDSTDNTDNTLDALLERLVHCENSDTGAEYTKQFLTVYKLFTTSRELLNLLLVKFDNFKSNTEEKAHKLQIIGVLRNWICVNKLDFVQDGLLASTFKVFLDSCKGGWLSKWVGMLEQMLFEQEQEEEEERCVWYLTQDIAHFSLLTLHPVELAHQITLIEHSYFTRAHVSDIFRGEGEALTKLRAFQDSYVFWMRRSVVEMHNLEERRMTLKCIFEILKNLHSAQNYSGMFAVYNVVRSAEVFRLKHSLHHLLPEYRGLLDQVEELTKNGYRKYWETLGKKTPPLIPVIGLYLKVVKKLKFTEGDEIRFSECSKLYKVISHLNVLQRAKYTTFSCEAKIKDYLLGLRPYEAITRKQFLSDLYDKSLLLEPTNTDPVYFPRKTTYDLSRDPAQFFSWKSTSLQIEKGFEKSSTVNVEQSPEIVTLARPLTKSKSFCSKAPPRPPRLRAVHKSNCLNRSKSFEVQETHSPYDMYVLPNRRNIRVNEKRSVSPVLLQNIQSTDYSNNTINRSNIDNMITRGNIDNLVTRGNIDNTFRRDNIDGFPSPPVRRSRRSKQTDLPPPPDLPVKERPARRAWGDTQQLDYMGSLVKPPPLPPKSRAAIPPRPPRHGT